jgi:anti-sigma factor RsiW
LFGWGLFEHVVPIDGLQFSIAGLFVVEGRLLDVFGAAADELVYELHIHLHTFLSSSSDQESISMLPLLLSQKSMNSSAS